MKIRFAALRAASVSTFWKWPGGLTQIKMVRNPTAAEEGAIKAIFGPRFTFKVSSISVEGPKRLVYVASGPFHLKYVILERSSGVWKRALHTPPVGK